LALCLLLLFKRKVVPRAISWCRCSSSHWAWCRLSAADRAGAATRHSAHSIVFVGLLPLATAMFGVLRGGERPRPVFWIFSVLGSALVVGFALAQGLTPSPKATS
jgi:hypothetical protein